MTAFFDIADFVTDNLLWIVIAAGVILLVIIIAVASAVKKKKRRKITQAEETKNARYSLDPTPVKYDDTANATYVKGDIIVSKGQTVVAGKGNDIIAGKYTVLTSVEGVEAFNVRVNGFVREIKHNSTIVLGEGDSFCPVSHSVILR